MPDVLIVTGPPASGKTAVAQALADRYDRVAHIDVEVLRHFVTPTGYAKPGQPEHYHQRLLGVRNAGALALNFLRERFGVIIEDVLDEPDMLAYYLDLLANVDAPVHLVQLLPSLKAVEQRDMQRRRSRSTAPSLAADYARYVDAAAGLPGSVIDSSDLDANATADKVQALTTSGASLIMASMEA